jgi:hypothetical protein
MTRGQRCRRSGCVFTGIPSIACRGASATMEQNRRPLWTSRDPFGHRDSRLEPISAFGHFGCDARNCGDRSTKRCVCHPPSVEKDANFVLASGA